MADDGPSWLDLGEDESIVLDTYPRLAVYSFPAAGAILALMLLSIVGIGTVAVVLVGFLIVVEAVFVGAVRRVRYVVTTDRIVTGAGGLFGHNELALDDVTDVQSFGAMVRVRGHGDVELVMMGVFTGELTEAIADARDR